MKILLVGGGNQLRYSVDIVEREGRHEIVGIIDSIQPIGTKLLGYEIIGRQEEIAALAAARGAEGGLITVGDNWSRKLIRDEIVASLPGFRFVNAIHPSVITASGVRIGVGVVAMAGVIFNPGARLGDFTFFATGAQIEHDCEIDDYASVSAGTILGGYVKIGKYSAVTLGVTIVDRVSIGENTVVGAGALVTRSLPDNVLAYGSPARVVRPRTVGERFLR
jgi:sugar O-acyltransferase (sialic acid O-acetyltransferase NeuD family)